MAGHRPRSITFVGWLFIAVGVGAIVRGLWPLGATEGSSPELAAHHARDGMYAAASGVLAMLGGAFVLRGRNWARWLLIAWMAAHVYLSLHHEPFELVTHMVVLVAGLYVLFRAPASAFFRGEAPPGALPDAPVS